MVTLRQGREFGYHFFEEIIDWIGGYCNPEDIFDREYLIDWAMTNGYIKEEECPDE